MRKSVSPVRSLVVLASLLGLAVVPTYTAPAPAATTLPDLGVPTLFNFYGINVAAVAAGDLNGDGNADVVAAGPGIAGVRVGLGDGSGALSAFGTFGTGAGISAVALADFDGDGHLDAVTSNLNNHSGTTFSVLFGTGTGAFTGEVTYSLGTTTTPIVFKVAAGDVTGDGRPDIVTLSGKGCGSFSAGCSNVTVFKNNGAGGFSSGFTRAYFSPSGYYYSGYADVQVADINGDEKGDLVLAIGTYDGGSDPQIQIMPGSGAGSFGATQYYRFPLVNGIKPFHTSSIAVGDVTGDGEPDLVAMAQRVGYNTSSHLIVMRNDGTGQFKQTSGSAHSLNNIYSGGVQIGDLNDDGKLDIAGSVSNGYLTYVLNDGTGNFPASTTNVFIHHSPGSIVLADLNNSGSGTLDIAMGGGAGVTVFINGTSTATPCAAGTYSASGDEPCAPADPGYFVATEGATSQTACPSGFFSGLSGATACTLAPAGSYAPGPAATWSLLCPAGTYSASEGAAACTPADAGSYVPAPGATSQTACPTGYSSDGGAIECYPIDTDGDGVNDIDDAYPNSNMHPTVQVGACTAGVANQTMPNGATFNDLLAAVSGANHGQRVSAVSALSNGWKSAGLISGRDHGAIVSCVARSK